MLLSPRPLRLIRVSHPRPELQRADSQQVEDIEKAIASLATDTLERSALEDWHSRKIMDRVNEKLDKGEGVIDIDAETLRVLKALKSDPNRSQGFGVCRWKIFADRTNKFNAIRQKGGGGGGIGR